MTRLVLAAAQIACRPGDVAANVATHRSALAEAQARGADLVVFPELSLTDYETQPDIAALARPADAPELRDLAAATGGLVAVVGFIERAPDGAIHNAAAILAEGRIAAIHRKLNLPTYGALVESEHYGPGDALEPVDTPVGRLATLVCADTWNPALPWLAALAGAGIMAVPIASARGAVDPDFDSRDGWRVNLRHTALTYGLPIVMANHCGRRGALDFWGGSTILDANGRVLAEAGDKPDLVTASVEAEDCAAARARLPTVRDADPALVATLLGARLARSRPGGPESRE